MVTLKTVVVARLNEDLSWTDKLNKDIKVDVVQKGVDLEEYGREAASFFWYIIKHYNKLKGHYIFVQGKPFDHAPQLVEKVNECSEEPYIEFGNELHQDTKISKFHSNPTVNIGEVYEGLFNKPSPEKFGFVAGGGQFMVSTNNIKRHNKSFYEKALSVCRNNEMAPWIFERLWRTIFKGE